MAVSWLINGGDPNHLLSGVILQVGRELMPKAAQVVLGHDFSFWSKFASWLTSKNALQNVLCPEISGWNLKITRLKSGKSSEPYSPYLGSSRSSSRVYPLPGDFFFCPFFRAGECKPGRTGIGEPQRSSFHWHRCPNFRWWRLGAREKNVSVQLVTTLLLFLLLLLLLLLLILLLLLFLLLLYIIILIRILIATANITSIPSKLGVAPSQ